ncbi:DUF397 domain-containing protein [Streptomyces collinus]|uniref:DUF397 domain-containing protein n=1 Tax=Streptomyces collinus TaxID=42684 RepID=UPI00369888C2
MSSSEASGNACVEVAVRSDTRVAIRHSIYPARGLSVERMTFSSFVSATRAGALSDDSHQPSARLQDTDTLPLSRSSMSPC